MAASIPDQPPPTALGAMEEALEAQVREIFGRTVYTHKAHEKCADEFLTKHNNLHIAEIVLSAITTTSLFLAVFGDSKLATICGAVFSTVLLAVSTLTKDRDYGQLAQRHSATAHQLWTVREDYLSLLTDIVGRLENIDHLRARRDQLQQRLDKIYSNVPRTTDSAYAAAQEALKHKEELTFSTEEIDAFLPPPLRRGNSRNKCPEPF